MIEKLAHGVDKLLDLVGYGEKWREWKKKRRAMFEEWGLMYEALKRSPLAKAGAAMALAFLILGVFGPQILMLINSLYGFLYSRGVIEQKVVLDPYKIFAGPRLGKPSFLHPFGCDEYGRDLFARVLTGARVSLIVSIVVISLGVPPGILLGLLSGYYGGKVDELIMRVTDVFLAFPALVLAMAIAASLGAGLKSAIIALTIVWWPSYVRLVRGQVLSARENVYVEAARAIGVSSLRIMVKHILPNIVSPIVVLATLDFGTVVILNAALSFIGLGAQPPIPEWGRIVYDGLDYLMMAPWYSIIPGAAVFVTALGFNLLGDGFRDVLDPRIRRRIEFAAGRE